ncbi:hypothetical protein [Brasilonema bromeliae]|uniref:hypothetical protein n=1 Tax=Brasilonema bromeliae TaxID=383615 RepID=UPI001B7D10FA|nr:hypothetical protein [Brasilonema bromeliae]
MTNTDINTFHNSSTEVGWKDELIESLRRSHQAQDWLPLSPAERDKLCLTPQAYRVTQAKQSFPMMVPLGRLVKQSKTP